MRPVHVLALAILAFSFAHSAHAVILNDSTFIDLEGEGTSDVTPDEPGIFDDDPFATGDEGGEESGEEGEGEEGSGGGSAGSPSFDTVTVSGDDDSESESESSAAAESATSSVSSGSDSSASASDILGTLFGNQAASVKGGGGQGGWEVRVNGKSVRDSLAARGIFKLLIPGFGSGGKLRLQNGEDFALVAASTALTNHSLEEAVLTLGKLRLSYQAQGNLFGFVPLKYRIRVEVDPEAAPASQVAVKFPWYRFFLRTYITREQITGDVSASLEEIKTASGSIDARARLLAAISAKLQERFDTVEGSVTAR